MTNDMNTVTTTAKKITLSTLKSFIRDNRENMYINVKSDFDGMTDCVEQRKEGFKKATEDKTVSKSSSYYDRTMGIEGAWFVGSSRDYFTAYSDEKYTGF